MTTEVNSKTYYYFNNKNTTKPTLKKKLKIQKVIVIQAWKIKKSFFLNEFDRKVL